MVQNTLLPIRRLLMIAALGVGLKLGQAILGAARGHVRGTYVGISVGIKRFYGQRDHLK